MNINHEIHFKSLILVNSFVFFFVGYFSPHHITLQRVYSEKIEEIFSGLFHHCSEVEEVHEEIDLEPLTQLKKLYLLLILLTADSVK